MDSVQKKRPDIVQFLITACHPHLRRVTTTVMQYIPMSYMLPLMIVRRRGNGCWKDRSETRISFCSINKEWFIKHIIENSNRPKTSTKVKRIGVIGSNSRPRSSDFHLHEVFFLRWPNRFTFFVLGEWWQSINKEDYYKRKTYGTIPSRVREGGDLQFVLNTWYSSATTILDCT